MYSGMAKGCRSSGIVNCNSLCGFKRPERSINWGLLSANIFGFDSCKEANCCRLRQCQRKHTLCSSCSFPWCSLWPVPETSYKARVGWISLVWCGYGAGRCKGYPGNHRLASLVCVAGKLARCIMEFYTRILGNIEDWGSSVTTKSFSWIYRNKLLKKWHYRGVRGKPCQ